MTKSTFVYVSYIRTSPERLWKALTEPEFMRKYWFGCHVESAWTAGSEWRLLGTSGQELDAGEIVTSEPPHRLVIRWGHRAKPELAAEGPSLCTLAIEQLGPTVKLTILHEIERSPSLLIEAVSGGWPKVVSNLKSLLESGTIALDQAYPAAAAT